MTSDQKRRLASAFIACLAVNIVIALVLTYAIAVGYYAISGENVSDPYTLFFIIYALLSIKAVDESRKIDANIKVQEKKKPKKSFKERIKEEKEKEQ